MAADYPRLYIGQSAKEFKARVSVPICRVTDTNDLTALLERYSSIQRLESPLVIEDLAYLKVADQGMLLKFIEESPLRIILLSSYDQTIPTILSRVNTIYKSAGSVESSFHSPAKGRAAMDSYLSENSYYLDQIAYQGKSSPIMYMNDMLVPKGMQGRAKLLMLLEGGGESSN